ncbi:MAG: FAD-binding oxidoreductase [Phycisphaerae bacterium]|jgi:FAD/FMN-containing dehydrogenase|nr:FAD-binding oxidoreductase [Phycisphaerae bacterium]MBT6270096.1 FAD-binding oxidoreductase [Phycisphaerae bacterium]MBT6283344.1 FAD-binding oxidoreductase [Phycisphaerae bacterium]
MERREFLKSSSAVAIAFQLPWFVASGCAGRMRGDRVVEHANGILVNDAHAAMNATWVREIQKPETAEALQKNVRDAVLKNMNVSISGGRHALGQQQFATDSMLIDTTSLHTVIGLDSNNGIVKVEAGIRWPELMEGLRELQPGETNPWVIRQKQGGSDGICLGGTLSANAHGRGLGMKPIVDDIEYFELINAAGELVFCSRTQNPELFNLAIGGYGLFGVIYAVGLRLMRREKLRRVVQVVDIAEVVPLLEKATAEGCKYGDFQYDIDEQSPSFMKKGICTWYAQESDTDAVPVEREQLSTDTWLNLLYLACTDRRKGFDAYTEFFQSTHGQLYWSDTSQLSTYNKGYRDFINAKIEFDAPVSLMLSELYTPREKLPEFMAQAADILRASGIPNIYGTIRMIEKDDETFLPWAKENYACVIFNLLVTNTALGKSKAADTFRALIDVSIALGGSYYLTYHKWSRKDQVLACYEQMPAFLEQKAKYDPNLVFQSDWYRHQHQLLS